MTPSPCPFPQLCTRRARGPSPPTPDTSHQHAQRFSLSPTGCSYHKQMCLGGQFYPCKRNRAFSVTNCFWASVPTMASSRAEGHSREGRGAARAVPTGPSGGAAPPSEQGRVRAGRPVAQGCNGNSEHQLSLRIFLGPSGPPRDEVQGGRAVASCPQDRRCQECAVGTSSPTSPASCLHGGPPESVRPCSQERQALAGTAWAACPPGPWAYSTKKRSSTTSRTAKRTAMAHHWRRSARQDTRVSARDSTFPRAVT